MNKPIGSPKTHKKTAIKNKDIIGNDASDNGEKKAEEEGTTIYASGAIAQNTDLTNKAVITGRRRARTHHSVLNKESNDETNDLKIDSNSNENESKTDESKDKNNEQSVVYASGAISHTTQIEAKAVIPASRRRARSHQVATNTILSKSYTVDSQSIYNVKTGVNQIESVDQVTASMDKPVNAHKKPKSRKNVLDKN